MKGVNLVFRRLQRGDEPMISSLFKKVFGREIQSEYWDWKYFQNPAGEHAMYVAIEPTEGKIVGEVGIIPVKMRLQGREVIANQTVDTVVLPEYQKGGTFFKLEKLARQEVINRNMPITYGLSVKETHKISTKLLEFKEVTPIVRIYKILDPKPILYKKIRSRFLASTAGALGRLLVKFEQKMRRPRVNKGSIELEEIEQFDSRFDSLWQRESQNYEAIVVRDSQYLNWRYIENPMARYKNLGARDGDTVRGFMVLSIDEQDGMRRGRIVDIFIEKERMDIFTILINSALDYFISEKAAMVATWPGDEQFSTLFTKAGFTKRGTPHDLIVRSYDEGLPYEYLTSRKNWYLTMGDSDYF